MIPLEMNEIQGMVLHGHPRREAAAYLLLEVIDAPRARSWLDRLLAAGLVGTSGTQPGTNEPLVNLAVTHPGLAALGLPQQGLDSFVGEFQEGMCTEHRSRVLGDVEHSAPANWDWGAPGGQGGREDAVTREQVHLLLVIFCAQQDQLDLALRDLRGLGSGKLSAAALGGGLRELCEMIGVIPSDGKEHFGFRDGISQPIIERAITSKNPVGRFTDNTVKPGEFVLGYENEFARLPASPSVPAHSDSGNLLTEAPSFDPGGVSNRVDPRLSRDFGRNGSYLVFRKLHQHVDRFNEYLKSAAGDDSHAQHLLAAKMVGRWKDGTPLALSPQGPNESLSRGNDFAYHDIDPDGVHCPMGSHIRRTNPRDALTTKTLTPAGAERLVRQHRIIRRGRPYSSADGDGLLFLCFNANIQRQFEFVQHSWVNNPKLAGLYDEVDPILGTQPREGGNFTVPGDVVAKRHTALPSFVDTRGGAYFFLPSMSALRYLANLS